MNERIRVALEKPMAQGVLGFLGRVAEVAFEMVIAAAEAIDEMPLERKHRFKRALVKGLPKPTPDLEKALFGKETELAEIMTRFEWWVLERDITGPVHREILRLGRAGNRAELDAYLCGLFSANGFLRFERKVANWFDVPYLSVRRELIEQCVAAHKERHYYLSIGALLPLLDGITRNFRREVLQIQSKKTAQGKPRPRTIEVVLVAGYYLRHQPALWGRPFFRAIEKGIYGRFKFGEGAAPSSLNRHAILHGEITDFGDEANSLRIFLLLDTIQHFYKDIQRQKAARQTQLLPARIAIPTPMPK